MKASRQPQGPSLRFDLIDAATFGYQCVWNERKYLLRLAFIPVFIKFIAMIAYYALGYDGDLLRRGLILLPATFAEGWVLAQFLRTILMDERWPRKLPTERDDAVIMGIVLRARGVISSTLIFVLIQLVSTVVAWQMLMIDASAKQFAQNQEAAAASGSAAQSLLIFPVIAILIGLIWAFRLMWVNIPYVVLMPVRAYLSRLGGMMASVRMLGLFLVCVIPLTVLVTMVSQFIFPDAVGPDSADAPALARFVTLLLAAVTDMLTALIATAAMAYALRDIVPHQPGMLKDVNERKAP